MTTHVRIGPEIVDMSDEEIVELFNETLCDQKTRSLVQGEDDVARAWNRRPLGPRSPIPPSASPPHPSPPSFSDADR